MAALVLVLAASSTSAATWSGTLSGGGLIANYEWASTSTSIYWEVTDLGGGSWDYYYKFTVPNKGLSNLLIETTEPIFGVTPKTGTGFMGMVGPAEYTNADANWHGNLPGRVYGVKFNPGDLVSVAEFTVARAPVWGNFYADDGKEQHTDDFIYAYNSGFANAGADPTYRQALTAANYTSSKFIARPDGAGSATVPEWGSLALGLIAMPPLAMFRRRRK